MAISETDYLLACLAEECNEVGQRVMKAFRFGLNEKQKGQEWTNAERIVHEMIDLFAVVEMLFDRDILAEIDDSSVRENAKKLKIEKYLAYAREIGAVE